jgi:hypothetical protein
LKLRGSPVHITMCTGSAPFPWSRSPSPSPPPPPNRIPRCPAFTPFPPPRRACGGLWRSPVRAAPCARIWRMISGDDRTALVEPARLPVPARCRCHIDGNLPSIHSGVVWSRLGAPRAVLVTCSSGVKDLGRHHQPLAHRPLGSRETDLSQRAEFSGG